MRNEMTLCIYKDDMTWLKLPPPTTLTVPQDTRQCNPYLQTEITIYKLR